jgi:FAD/FMN-containing dehydrogenase
MASERTLGAATVAELEQALRGELIRPGHEDYEQARKVWNGVHDRHPALIVRCHGLADVVEAVRFARSERMVVAVRGGGHSIPGFSTCDGGMVIDLSPMREVRVDAAARVATAEAGATWKEFDRATQEFGLATTGGLISSTGIAGFTLGGGVGWLMRRHGLACDNLLAATVVTADAQVVHATADENPDLFWGLRGGGGNFGVVTSFTYSVHPVGPTVLAGRIFFPGERAGDILRFHRRWAENAPDELTTLVSLATAPPAPFLPERWHGRPIVVIAGLYAGAISDGERVAEPLRSLEEPIADLMAPMPYTQMQSLRDGVFGPGTFNYYKAGFCLNRLDDQAIEALVHHHRTVTSPMSEIHVYHLGGQVARVPAEATAFGDRSAPFLLNIVARTQTGDGYDDAVTWANDLHTAIAPTLNGRAYVNFLSNEGASRVRAAYRDNYQRLRVLKNEYDPTNLFRLNQNIDPTGSH